jgi:hypothetical protein
MIGVAGERQLDTGAAGYGIHDAQSPPSGLQYATLLNMQFEESRNPPVAPYRFRHVCWT